MFTVRILYTQNIIVQRCVRLQTSVSSGQTDFFPRYGKKKKKLYDTAAARIIPAAAK